jgi:3,4-dihydroxy 2-butanone 4-phosphate synthase/GTP cyclohydrolase II
MSALTGVTERFAAGEAVLIGGDDGTAMFVAAAADLVDADRLDQLQQLGGGRILLGLTDAIARRLELQDIGPEPRQHLDLSLTTPIDAVGAISGGWSLRDRARTMRVAADADTEPHDLAIPGHVHPARIDDHGSDTAAAAIELARLSRRAPAVALCAVIDRDGAPATLRQARERPGLGQLPLVGNGQLHSLSISRQAQELSVSCELPTRYGDFRAIGYAPTAEDPAIVALVHGDPAHAVRPLVHVHVHCLLGDAFGSLLCNCRDELEQATATIIRDGAGVIIYAKPANPGVQLCSQEHRVDPVLSAGLLRAVGTSTFRLSAPARRLAHDLRACGLHVAR